MKKSTFISTLSFALIMLLSLNVNAQKFADLDKSPLDITYFRASRNDAPKGKVVYSRPQLNGRTVSSLTPNGKVWRTGANESVEVTFYQDVTFGDKSIKAGTYSLFTIPGEKEWIIILNSDLNAWGSYSYNESNDVARVTASTEEGKKSLEAFTIAFHNDNMYFGWGTLRVAVSIK